MAISTRVSCCIERNIIAKVQQYLKLENTAGLELLIKDPVAACEYSMDRARAGNDTISVTGNVLRDYL